MKGLRCQLKSVLHDKFCLMTFFLPIIAGAALNLAGSMKFSEMSGLHFGVLKGDLTAQTATWLERYGSVTAFITMEELMDAVKEPSTNLIGVEADGRGIQTIISGDELEIFRQTADTLPDLYQQRNTPWQAEIYMLECPDGMDELQDMLMAVTLIAAMFMGCTFNAMNMISEKEDGIAFINEILPMTQSQYILQKLIVGFICGSLSSIITACICLRISLENMLLMLALIALSAFVAALAGLFIGRVSNGLMVGVVYIKIVMLLCLAVPILSFLVGIKHPLLSAVCYFVPSQAAFEGIMDLSAGRGAGVLKNLFILSAHSAGWFLLYIGLSVHQRKKA